LAQEGEGEGDATEQVEAGGEETVAEGEAAAESSSGISALGINLGFLIAQIINFLLIMTLLTVILWKPVVNMLDSRSAKIEKGLEDAAAAANARRNAEAEAEKILAQARTESAQIVEEGRSRGDEVAKAIEADARKSADKIREDARVSAQAERNTELSGLRGQVAAISVAVAQRLIGETLDAKRQKALIDDFFVKVPAEAKSLSGDVEVVSAMPLDDKEQGKVKKEIGADNVTFKVDPSILGGLVIRAGDRVVDGSVRASLGDLAGRLN
jgi:F-type H+-transporting ATPase subunit b